MGSVQSAGGDGDLVFFLKNTKVCRQQSPPLSCIANHQGLSGNPLHTLSYTAAHKMSVDMESDHAQQKQTKSKHRHRQDKEEAAADKMDVDKALEDSKPAKEKKKKSKDKKRKERAEDVEEEAVQADPTSSPEKKHKRHKSGDKAEKKDKKLRKHHKHASSPSAAPADSSMHTQQAAIPDDKQYPFFTQTFSQRIPIWPAAFDEPLTKTAREYLDPMLNRYSPKFKGVLLAYKNINLSDRPRRADPTNLPTDDTPVVLESFECYAPPFAWLTADLHLFVPTRGAWMEGEINLQSEGHIGVVCFEKFNASISRRSLPKGWSWVEQTEEELAAAAEEEEDPFGRETSEVDGEGGAEGNVEGQEHGKAKSAPRLRSTGYWLDENGAKVDGKIYFRIKNFSSGSTGDYTYLSLQGTMLDPEAERESAAEEREMEKARRARQNTTGLLYPTMRLPEFSMTKLKDDLI